MEPTQQQIVQYLQYLQQSELVDKFKTLVKEEQERILEEFPNILEKNHDIDEYDYEVNIDLASINLDTIESIEFELDYEYNDEGGTNANPSSITINGPGYEDCVLTWENAENLLCELDEYGAIIEELDQTISFKDIKKPCNLQVVE
jgi:hypothetical protein